MHLLDQGAPTVFERRFPARTTHPQAWSLLADQQAAGRWFASERAVALSVITRLMRVTPLLVK
jgi:hypothetical protein